MSKKSLITAVSTAAMVATLGFAYAQSSDEGALANSNVNGSIDNSVPKHWARDDVAGSDPYATAAPTAAGPATSTMPAPSDTSTTTASTATPPATDANSPWAADTTSTPPADASSTTSSTNTTDGVNQTNSSLSTNTTQSAETHIDLNSPNDPIYNMGRDNSVGTERSPRPDRN